MTTMVGTIDGYTGLKFVHVLAAMIWVGGAAAANIQGTRIKRTGDGDRLAAFGRDTEGLGTHVYFPASLVVLVFGILTALKGHYSFGQAWLLIGIAGIVLTSITGSAGAEADQRPDRLEGSERSRGRPSTVAFDRDLPDRPSWCS